MRALRGVREKDVVGVTLYNGGGHVFKIDPGSFTMLEDEDVCQFTLDVDDLRTDVRLDVAAVVGVFYKRST